MCNVACNTGFGNCNNDPADGCEVDTTSSPGACGACGQECLFDNAQALCVNSNCQ